jgi:hypothetical protein
MKKLLLFAAILLASCSKEEVNCAEVFKKYEGEVKHAGSNIEKIKIIQQKYKSKYPSCKF